MKNAWSILCFIAGAVVVFLLLAGNYRPELMRELAIATAGFFLALAWLPYAPVGLDAKIAAGYVLVIGAVCFLNDEAPKIMLNAGVAVLLLCAFRTLRSAWRKYGKLAKNGHTSP